MLKKWILAALLCTLLFAERSFADHAQVVAGTTGDTIIAASEGKLTVIKALAVISTSTTSVICKLYNEDNYLLGDADTGITIDADGIDGPSGFIMPYNDHGWFVTDAANEAVKIGLSSSTKVIVIVIYSYKTAY